MDDPGGVGALRVHAGPAAADARQRAAEEGLDHAREVLVGVFDRVEGEGRVAFRYGESVNGSQRGIAGVLNAAGNVLGMMPHPERAIEPAHIGSTIYSWLLPATYAAYTFPEISISNYLLRNVNLYANVAKVES